MNRSLWNQHTAILIAFLVEFRAAEDLIIIQIYQLYGLFLAI